MAARFVFLVPSPAVAMHAKCVGRVVGRVSPGAGRVFPAVVCSLGDRESQVRAVGSVRVLSSRFERLSDVTERDVIMEGFPDLTVDEFVSMFLRYRGGDAAQEVTRIHFDWVE